VLRRIADAAFPGRRVTRVESLGDGYRNANFKLEAEPGGALVLRIYEHDASLCRKEADLRRLVRGSVPVPEEVYVEPDGWEDVPPFAVLAWTEGITFRELKRGGDREAIAQAAGAAGRTLAAIGGYGFAGAGWIGPGPAVTAPLLAGADPLPRFVDLCLARETLRRRAPAETCRGVHELMWSCAARLAEMEREARLVHGDFNKRNVLVRERAGRWEVAAVIDWEFAVAGPPLADLGSFLRYERAGAAVIEPHFSRGYLDGGGGLPEDWRQMARVVDLAAICESLASARLPEPFVPELVELVRAAAG